MFDRNYSEAERLADERYADQMASQSEQKKQNDLERLENFIEQNREVYNRGFELGYEFDERTFCSTGKACFIEFISSGHREISWDDVAYMVGREMTEEDYERLSGF